ncbi:hypothetical protein Scel_83730 [Streptomyces cellostaticus]|nr:hypothetical protein Scel_83730 [Streptomyces cellostaticus]
MVHGGREFLLDQGRDLLAAVLTECGAADVRLEVAGLEMFLGGRALEEAFREEGLERFGEVEGEGVAAAVGVAMQEACARTSTGP